MEIGIVGLGLIGGSLGLDFRRLGHRVIGVSRQRQTCDAALARGAVDEASQDLACLQATAVVFICTPIALIGPVVQQLIPHLSNSAIITDVGSVKASISEVVTPLWSNFVGGHPMAGKAEAGIQAAEANLFANRAYVITPTAATPPACIATVTHLAKELQARVYTCTPEAHDRAVAWISHLPVMVSTSLIQACLQESDEQVRGLAECFASSGFKDTSRVGGGNPELGMMMAQYNRQEVLRSLYTYRHQLDHLIDTIEQQHWDQLESKLQQSHDARPRFIH